MSSLELAKQVCYFSLLTPPPAPFQTHAHSGSVFAHRRCPKVKKLAPEAVPASSQVGEFGCAYLLVLFLCCCGTRCCCYDVRCGDALTVDVDDPADDFFHMAHDHS